jgi:hypothetical protein
MTFTEAALEVLRSAGEPLHYKRITELAIAGNLLSHVGKTPEVTMSSRLATLVKKDRGQSPIVKVKPGVFALRESSMHTDKESSPNGSSELPGLATSLVPKLEVELSERPLERPERTSLPGADVFPEEADDDAPILAGIDEGGLEDRGRRRRRRRRRGKGGSEGLAAEPDGERRPEVVRGDGPPVRPDRESARADRDPGQGRDSQRRDREPSGRRERDSGRRDLGRRDRDTARNDRPGREALGRDESPQEQLDFTRPPAEGDLLGKDLADAAYQVLSRGERAATSFVRVAELLVRRGRLNGSPATLAPTVAAALRADAARAQRAQGRPRFRIVSQRVSLSEWLLPRDAVRSEENVEQAADAQRDQVRRAFVARLNDLPAAGFAELIATWLNGEGVTALRAVRRPGSSLREFHFAGTLRRGVEENRLALVVLRSGRDIDRETVVEIRGSLHHYGGATGAWLITTGRINPTAREEIAVEGAAPVALFGGVDLARAMEVLGIGLRQHFVPLCDIDFDLLEALGDGGLVQARRDERPSRDPDRDREQDRDRGRGRERDRERDPRDRGSRPELAAAAGAEPSEPPPPMPVDPSELRELELLEAAEASRLVGGASWDPEADESGESDEGDEASEADIELRNAADDSEDDSADERDGAEDFADGEVDLDPDSDDDDGDDDLSIADGQELERRERDSTEPDDEA